MKKIIALVLTVFILCTAVVGCSPKDSDVIELTFWHLMSGNGGEALQRQVDAFNNGIGAEKGIKVKTVYVDWPGTSAFATALASGNSSSMPDVFQLYGEMVSYVSELDSVMWAEDYINTEHSQISKEDFVPATLEAFTINDKLLSLPYAISTLLLYYNETYLNEAGYSAPPSTIDELASMLPNIVNKTDAQYGIHTKIGDYELENFITIQGANGSYVTDNHNGRTGSVTELICEEQLSAFLNEWNKVIDTNTVNYSSASTTEEFATGIDAMALMTSARIADVEKMVGDSFEWGVTGIPVVNPTDAGGSTVNGSSIVMFDHNDDRRAQATLTFMEYLTSTEAQTMLMEDMGYLPVNVNTLNYDPYKEAIVKQPQLGVLFEVLNKAPSTAVMSFFPNNSEINNAMYNAIEKFSKKEISATEATSKIISDCKGILDEYYRTNSKD